MANEVFANGLEIACKAAEGVSAEAFPDPCWSPPPPNGGWVLTLFSNTAYARDTANASRTVMISGKPVMQKNKSYFKKSYGDEGAAGPKGFYTGVKLGKAYFTSWSMNVKVEGFNVDRHTDTITHNHASDPPNTTGKDHYLDQAAKAGTCKKVIEAKDKHCKVTKGDDQDFRKKRERTAKRRSSEDHKDKVKRKIMPDVKYIPGDRAMNWKDKNCKKHLFNLDDPEKLKDNIEKQMQELTDIVINYEDVITDKLYDVVADGALDRLKYQGGGTAAGAVIGGGVGSLAGGVGAIPGAFAGGAVGNRVGAALGWIDTAFDLITEGPELVDLFFDRKDELPELMEQIKEHGKTLDAMEKGLDSDEWKARQEELFEQAEAAAANNPCLKQKQCLLVPHTRKDKVPKAKDFAGTKADASPLDKVLQNPSNCCPGMTGHHLLPNTLINNGANCTGTRPYVGAGNKGPEGYKSAAAPTVCAIGGRTTGTHGDLHTAMDGVLQDMKDGDYSAGGYEQCGTDFTMACAIEAAAESHKRVYKHCDKQCIKKQLETYYDPLQCNPDMKDQHGNEVKSSEQPVEKQTVTSTDEED